MKGDEDRDEMKNQNNEENNENEEDNDEDKNVDSIQENDYLEVTESPSNDNETMTEETADEEEIGTTVDQVIKSTNSEVTETSDYAEDFNNLGNNSLDKESIKRPAKKISSAIHDKKFKINQTTRTIRIYTSTQSNRINGTTVADYEKILPEYSFEIEEVKAENFTYNIPESDVRKSLKRFVKKTFDFRKPRNCSQFDGLKFGIKAIKCVISDFKSANNQTQRREVLKKSWEIVKIWLFIYFLMAIPCWCHRGNVKQKKIIEIKLIINYSTLLFFSRLGLLLLFL